MRRLAVSGPWSARGTAASRPLREELESALLPRYSLVLVDLGGRRAPRPRKSARSPRRRCIRMLCPGSLCPSTVNIRGWSFPANFEYHANIDAVRFLVSEIWPKVRKRRSSSSRNCACAWSAAATGSSAICFRRPPRAHGIEVTGPVEDALAEIAQAPNRRRAPARRQRHPHQDSGSLGGGALRRRHPFGRRGSGRARWTSISLWKPIPPGLPPASPAACKMTPSRQRLAIAGRHTFEDQLLVGSRLEKP